MPYGSDKPAAATPETMAISRAVFDRIPAKRSAYVLAYVVYAACVFGPRIASLVGVAAPQGLMYLGDAIGIVALAIFAFHFFTTLRIMGYETWFSCAMTVISAPLIPGFFFVAFMDRRIANAWDAADPSGGYRKRPPADPE
jgi:hypothetical protein